MQKEQKEDVQQTSTRYQEVGGEKMREGEGVREERGGERGHEGRGGDEE